MKIEGILILLCAFTTWSTVCIFIAYIDLFKSNKILERKHKKYVAYINQISDEELNKGSQS